MPVTGNDASVGLFDRNETAFEGIFRINYSLEKSPSSSRLSTYHRSLLDFLRELKKKRISNLLVSKQRDFIFLSLLSLRADSTTFDNYPLFG